MSKKDRGITVWDPSLLGLPIVNQVRRSKTQIVRERNEDGNQVRVRILRKADNEQSLTAKASALRKELHQLETRVAMIEMEARAQQVCSLRS